MRAHQYVHRSAGQSFQYLLPLLSLHIACEQFHPYGQMAEKGAEGFQMLLCQYLGGSHDASLMSIVHSQ